MAYKKQIVMVLIISAGFLVSIQGVCWAQPNGNTKINKQDASPKELAMDQQVETKLELTIDLSNLREVPRADYSRI